MSTIITIKYAENIARANEAGDNTIRTPSEAPSTEKILLVNINCNIGLIGDYIHQCLRLEPTDEFDLWEESTSQLKNISSRKPCVSGLEVFQPNDAYLLILLERNSVGQLTNYVPLIGGKPSRALSELMAKARRQSKKKSSALISVIREKSGRKKLSGKSK